MNSIRARLGWGLGGILTVVLGAFMLLLYGYLRYVLLSDLDSALYDKARLFAAGSESIGGGRYEFEMIEARVPEYLPGKRAEYVQIWGADGAVLLRSPSLETHDLGIAPANDDPQFSNTALPDGRHGRMVTFGFIPHQDMDVQARAEPTEMQRLHIAFAASREGVERSLQRILGGLAFGALALMVCVLIALWVAVQLGLRPLGRIAEQALGIGAANLSHRFDTAGLPGELLPIVTRLNELLSRLQAAFARERRFTADAAHELRTPVAELRTLAEVGLLETEHADVETRGYLKDTLAIAKHLESLITGLLALVRFESDREAIALQGLDLAAMLSQTLASQDLKTCRADLHVSAVLPDEATVLANENLVRVLLENLLANVATYAATDGIVTLSLHKAGNSWQLQLSNTATELEGSDLEHILEPFWRKSADRGGQAHAGLGLALVAECARLMHVELRVFLLAPSTFLIESVWPAVVKHGVHG